MDSFFYWLKSTYFKDEILYSIPARKRSINVWNEGVVKYFFANEADMLDKIVFGLTVAEWKLSNIGKLGRRAKSIRENATPNQLVVLSSLEIINSLLMKKWIYRQDRFRFLVEHALSEFSLLSDNANKNRISIMLRGIDMAVVEGVF